MSARKKSRWNRSDYLRLLDQVATGKASVGAFLDQFDDREEAIRKVFLAASTARRRVENSCPCGYYKGYSLTFIPGNWSGAPVVWTVCLPPLDDPFSKGPVELGKYQGWEKATEAIDRHIAKTRKFERFQVIVTSVHNCTPFLAEATSISEDGNDLFVVSIQANGTKGGQRTKQSIRNVIPATPKNLELLDSWLAREMERAVLDGEKKKLFEDADEFPVGMFGVSV